MACNDYEWTPTTHDDVLKVVIWFQNKFNLRDWGITVETSLIPPGKFKEDEEEEKVLARCHPVLRRLIALIWIPLDRLERNDVNAISSVIHEMLHVFITARNAGIDSTDDNNAEECVVYSLEPALFQLYCWENKMEIPKLRENMWAKLKV